MEKKKKLMENIVKDERMYIQIINLKSSVK
jgi:hypothetical protein